MAPDFDRLKDALAAQYLLERELGRGGMATVYLAQDRQHDRRVAVKVLHPELAGSIGPERFLREIAITARLDHPHILPLLDSGKTEAAPFLYYVMPLVEGESLRDRLTRERQLPVSQAIQIARDVAGALAYAHSRGVIHRDIKPENILLANDHARVADFGIARAVSGGDDQRLTETGMAIGTAAYMSPEQATGEHHAVDARTDIYALGCVLYEMLGGEPPFYGPTPQAILARVLTESPRPLEVIRPGLPRALEAAIRRATARVPADRFQTANEFAAALGRVADRLSQGTEPMTVNPKAAPTRRGLRVALIAGPLLIAVLIGGLMLVPSRKTPVASVSSHTPTPEVLALYQRGIRAYDRRTAAGSDEAILAFNAAIARDSAYSRAWSGLAKAYVRAYGRRFTVRGVSWDSVVRLAVAAADAALASDSTDPEAWMAQSLVGRIVDPTDTGPRLRAARRALSLDSANAPAWHSVAIAEAERGNLAIAIEGWRHSVAASPSYTEGLAFLSLGHYWGRQYDSAAFWADSAVAVNPTFLLGRGTAGLVAIEQGDYVRALAAFDAAQRLSTDVEVLNSQAGSALAEARAGNREAARALLRRIEGPANGYMPQSLHTAVYLAQAYAAVGDMTRAVNWLGRYQPRRDLHFQLHLRCDPPFDSMAKDPRFQALLLGPPTCPAP